MSTRPLLMFGNSCLYLQADIGRFYFYFLKNSKKPLISYQKVTVFLYLEDLIMCGVRHNSLTYLKQQDTAHFKHPDLLSVCVPNSKSFWFFKLLYTIYIVFISIVKNYISLLWIEVVLSFFSFSCKFYRLLLPLDSP